MRDRGRQLDTESGGRKMDCSRLNNNSRERVEQSPMRPKHYHRRLCGGATAAPRKEQRPVCFVRACAFVWGDGIKRQR